ncbi:RagB/SusD family nutrient uptake outer membrane protein [Zobellia nedashkovskayae]
MKIFVFSNGSTDYQPDLPPIETFIGGRDASGGILTNATRTSYYLKKFLSSKVNLNPDRRVAGEGDADFKIFPIFSRGDLYLDFAEAAFEAYPSDGQGPFMFSSQDAVRKIRERGGISVTDDIYITQAVSDITSFRNLIHNERRIENAFEGEYFYDVRRWMLPLNELQQPIRGMKITIDNGSFSYDSNLEIEPRVFENNYYYNPIPRVEVLNSNAIIQNAGW